MKTSIVATAVTTTVSAKTDIKSLITDVLKAYKLSRGVESRPLVLREGLAMDGIVGVESNSGIFKDE